MAINILGYGPKTLANPSQAVPLTSGQGYVLPAGQYQVVPGSYTFLQWFDPVTLMWRSLGTPSESDASIISSDGSNYRLFNATGTMVGAIITTAGSGYTNGIYFPSQQLGTATAPSVTMSAGGGSVLAKPTLVIGGAINTTIAITSAGSNYTLPPVITISNPPQGGVPATATCTISGGVINAVTVTNQGAGYLVAPTVTITPAIGDLTGSGAVLTVNATLVGSGTVTAILVGANTPIPGTNPTTFTNSSAGVGMTSVPTFTFAPASTTAATAIMCFTATAATFTGATNAGNGSFGLIGSTVVAGTSVLTNPAITTGLFTPRMGFTAYSTTASPTTTVIVDGGIHQVVPNTVIVANSNGTISGSTTAATTAGGVTDLSYAVLI